MSESQSPTRRKPVVRLTGENGNYFNVLGLVRRAFQRERLPNEYAEFYKKVVELQQSGEGNGRGSKYDQFLQLVMEYCEVE